MNKNQIITILFLLHPFYCVFSQKQKYSDEINTIIEKRRFVRVMFYNCENFFDTSNDSLKNDEEFLPNGERHWNDSKYYKKQNNLSKVITAVGGWNPPEIVGLCEIENSFVLDGLTKSSPLYQFEYSLIHKESPDRRGIDVALLYKASKFKPLSTDFIQVRFNNSDSKTRDILYVMGKLSNSDTLHVFVNHWPSRWGGELESEHKRIQVAQIVKNKVDSIFSKYANAKIIIMGDLNDEPSNKSVSKILQANTNLDSIFSAKLYNLTATLYPNNEFGTHKYQGKWGILDHMIVSGNLINDSLKTHVSLDDIHIFNADFLLEPDESFLGVKPFRTYVGFKYNGGFSDHLPVFLDLHQ
ncbi:MAG: endonuclease [Salinivirgaceae bacterium]|nr:endonuclease [Salinivirgaceae bacterium]